MLMVDLSHLQAQLEKQILASRAQGPEVTADADRWSQKTYDRRRRRVDIWSFALGLRARQFLIDQKWSYPGGYTEEKVGASNESY